MMGATAGPAEGSRVCRLRGLPYSATQEEIRRFFGGYSLEEVYLCKRDGRSTGEAYVVFKSPLQASNALGALNKKYLGSRYIELFEAVEADLAAVKHVLEDTRLQGCVVRLRGLPYTATAADIAQFFEGIKVAEGDDAIVFTQTVDGRPTGEAYVELADQDACTAAMTRHKEVMGSRYIEVFHSTKIDKLQALQQKMSMPGAGLGRWTGHLMQPDMVAAAAAAGMHVVPGAMMPSNKPLPFTVDQLATSLQGTHLTSSLPMVPAGTRTPQQVRLPPGAIPIRPTAPQLLLQQQQQLAAPAAGPSSISSLPATTVALSSASSGVILATCDPTVAPVSTSTAAMQPQQPGVLAPGDAVQQVTFVQLPYNQQQQQPPYQQPIQQQQQQQQQTLSHHLHQQEQQQQLMRPMGMPTTGPPQMIVGLDGQAIGPAVYYPMRALQQGMVAPPYAVPAYTMQTTSMPPGPLEQPMLMPGPMRPMLVGGGQWVPHPPWT